MLYKDTYEEHATRRHTTFWELKVGFLLKHPEHIARIPHAFICGYKRGGGTSIFDVGRAPRHRTYADHTMTPADGAIATGFEDRLRGFQSGSSRADIYMFAIPGIEADDPGFRPLCVGAKSHIGDWHSYDTPPVANFYQPMAPDEPNKLKSVYFGNSYRERCLQIMQSKFLNSSGVWRPTAMQCLNMENTTSWIPGQRATAQAGLLTPHAITNLTAPSELHAAVSHLSDYGNDVSFDMCLFCCFCLMYFCVIVQGAVTELMTRGRCRYRKSICSGRYKEITKAQAAANRHGVDSVHFMGPGFFQIAGSKEWIDNAAEETGPLAPTDINSIERWREGHIFLTETRDLIK
jgi:hypothetical protein